MKAATLKDLFLTEIQGIYSMENQIIEAMPKMIEKISNPELKRAFTIHLEDTRKQAHLIDDLCIEFDVDPNGRHCVGIEGIIEEGQEILSANNPSPALDLAIIDIAQKIEHYEIASYGTVANYAQEMGHQASQDLLMEILAEEKSTDEKLTAFAELLIEKIASQNQTTHVSV